MASSIDICNIALSHLGDEAKVVSINPPDQSVQAQYCSIFYPIALASVIDEHNWGFCTKVIIPATITNTDPRWLYAYSVPSDMVNIVSVFDSVNGDYTNGMVTQSYSLGTTTTQDPVLFTNQAAAAIEYLAIVTNPDLFSPSFVDALSLKLSTYLCGILLKGDVGASAALRIGDAYRAALEKAKESDAQNRKVFVVQKQQPAGIAARA